MRVLSKIKYSYLNQNGESKMPDASKSFFNNNWRHHDVTVVVKDFLCLVNFLIWYGVIIYGRRSCNHPQNLDLPFWINWVCSE